MGVVDNYHAPKVFADVFVSLGEALQKQANLESEIYHSVQDINKKYGAETDFIGVPTYSDMLSFAVLECLGSEFAYWFYDCNQSFDKFNSSVTLEDGSHPDVHSLNDLYDFAIGNSAVDPEPNESNTAELGSPKIEDERLGYQSF